VELLGGSVFPPLGDLPYMLTLPGHSFYWFRLAPAEEVSVPSWHEEGPRFTELPVLVLPAGRETPRRARQAPLRLPSRAVAQVEREALPGFLGARRWFAAKGGEIESTEVVAQAGLGDSWLLALLRVRVNDGGPETAEPQLYFLPLAAAWEDGGEEDGVAAFLPHALARLRRRNQMGVLYDAMMDEEFCRGVIRAIEANRDLGIGEGEIHFSRTDVFEELLEDEDIDELPARRVGEQSNTSMILGEKLVLKAYRRLQKGTNPDLEIGRYLTEEVRFGNVPPLAGAIEYEGPDGEITTLGLLQGFVTNQGDGWTYTLDYLDRYLEDRLVTTSWSLEDEDRDVADREELRAEDTFFSNLMRTLGLRTGELHAALATDTEDPAFSPEPATPEEVAGWAEGILEELRRTFDTLRRRKNRLPEEVQGDVERLLEARKELSARIRAISKEPFGAVKTRHHGDYHLGQVLVASNDFQIIDFEGEPARPLEERRRKHSPLRDVAGMLRSFNYAANSALMNVSAERLDHLETAAHWVGLWERQARKAFLEGYVEGARGSASYPEDEEKAGALIELFTLEKALYEIRYELDNRPDWIGIPVRGIVGLVEREEDS